MKGSGIRTKITLLTERKGRARKRIIDKEFNVYAKHAVSEDNPKGYCFNLEPRNRCVFVAGKYVYLSKAEWNKLIRDLKRFIKWVEVNKK